MVGLSCNPIFKLVKLDSEKKSSYELTQVFNLKKNSTQPKIGKNLI